MQVPSNAVNSAAAVQGFAFPDSQPAWNRCSSVAMRKAFWSILPDFSEDFIEFVLRLCCIFVKNSVFVFRIYLYLWLQTEGRDYWCMHCSAALSGQHTLNWIHISMRKW